MSVEKKDFGAEQCKPAGIAQNDLATAQMLTVASQAPTVEAAPATTTYSVDLLVLYTTAAGTAMGGAAAVENNVAVRIASANQYLSQSQVDNVTWHVVGVVEAPGYTETGNLTTDLNNLASRGTAIGTFAAQQRDHFGADQVTLLVNNSTDGFAGIAYTPGAFSVSVRSSSAGVLAHELAHNFGCHHDRQQEKAADNDGNYYYGYRYTDPTTRQDTGTIMSYANFRVPYYSNPSLTYQGHVLGLAAGDPEAADNARVLRENAATIAGLRPSAAVGAPVITGQPASVTVSVGQSFTLAVTATGGDLSYQWAHGGAAIAAAMASSYAVKSATAGDAGSYAVTVSNSAGSVQSSPAMVTVSSMPSTSPPPTTGGTGTMGGGGGGGAPDAATATLLLAFLARLGRARRRGARAA